MSPCGEVTTAITRQRDLNSFCGDDQIPGQQQLSRLQQNRAGPFRPCQRFYSYLEGLTGPNRDLCVKKLLEHHLQSDIVEFLLSSLEGICTTCLTGQVSNPIFDHNSHHRELSSTAGDSSCSSMTYPSLQNQNVSLQHGMDVNEGNFPDDGEFDQNDSGFGSSGGVIFQKQDDHDSNRDIEKLERNAQEMSQCHFYYENIDSQSARDLLHKKPTGTFLIRDSSDSRYLYSLSVNTERGATSVRILYSNGLFQFDSDQRIRDKLPQFESVLELVDFHVRVTQDGGNESWRWEEMSGKKTMTVTLTKPLKNSVPSLAHLARVKTNKCLQNVHLPAVSVDRLPIQSNLKEYLKQYPYQV